MSKAVFHVNILVKVVWNQRAEKAFVFVRYAEMLDLWRIVFYQPVLKSNDFFFFLYSYQNITLLTFILINIWIRTESVMGRMAKPSLLEVGMLVQK